jgi:hypothetical protein
MFRSLGVFRSSAVLALACLTVGAVALVPVSVAQNDNGNPPITAPPDGKTRLQSPGIVKLKIVVTDTANKPVGNASVYVRFYEDMGGVKHKQNLEELDLKTNQDGTVKVPPALPQGKIQIQVIAKGLHTFGEWYDIEKDDQVVSIQLQEPKQWY